MKRKITICVCHALVLVAVHLIYFNMNLTMPLENEVIGAIGKTESHFGGAGRYNDSGFVFINTAFDNALLSSLNEEGDSVNHVIANRELLARFFNILADHGNQHRYVLCDIMFDLPSPDDAALRTAIARIDKFILPAHTDYLSHEQTPLIFSNKSALADYVTFEGRISKVRLFSREDDRKTLPLVMYEECNNTSTKVSWTGLWSGKNFIPYSIYPRYFFTQDRIRPHELSLGKIVKMLEVNGALFYQSFLKDKIIVIGNFHSDRHLTPIGQFMPGSLVLFNTYLSLQSNAHYYNWLWLVAIFLCFTLLSYYELYFRLHTFQKSKWPTVFRVLSLSGLCITISLVSNLTLGLYTTVLPVILYFECVHFLKRFYHLKQPA